MVVPGVVIDVFSKRRIEERLITDYLPARLFEKEKQVVIQPLRVASRMSSARAVPLNRNRSCRRS